MSAAEGRLRTAEGRQGRLLALTPPLVKMMPFLPTRCFRSRRVSLMSVGSSGIVTPRMRSTPRLPQKVSEFRSRFVHRVLLWF